MSSNVKTEAKPLRTDFTHHHRTSQSQRNAFPQRKKNNCRHRMKKKPSKTEQNVLIRAKNRLAKAQLADTTRIEETKKASTRKKNTIQQIFKKYTIERSTEPWKPVTLALSRNLYQYAHDLHQKREINSVH